jgi:phosphatidylglycerophosphate synthase
MTTAIARRELATRQAAWARRLAEALAQAGVRPNVVSVASVACAAAATIAFGCMPYEDAPRRAVLSLAAAAAIQLRLLCNLLDGMLAVEQRLQTATGALYNEIPDRLADVMILAGAGYSIASLPGGVALGWLAAAAALFTAYVRQLGGALTGVQHFIGPMAKPHRMFALTIAAALAAVEAFAGLPPRVMAAALGVITAGTAITAWRRISRIAAALEER